MTREGKHTGMGLGTAVVHGQAEAGQGVGSGSREAVEEKRGPERGSRAVMPTDGVESRQDTLGTYVARERLRE